AAAGLNARLFIGGNNELIRFQSAALPVSGVQIENAARLGGEVWVAGKDPAAVIPGPNGVFVQAAPQRAAADGGHQAALLDMLNQVCGAPRDSGRSCFTGSSQAKALT